MSENMKKTAIFRILALALPIFLAACAGGNTSSAASVFDEGPIKLGAVYSLTGPRQATSQYLREAVQMAV
ncbi:MAG: hypothetical protein LBQ73_11435, partial [Tannerellaceae bacterium]|nr:hypothetical protein [Tannerellaceae bacterium]